MTCKSTNRAIKALNLTVIPLRYMPAGELCRWLLLYSQQKGQSGASGPRRSRVRAGIAA
jgi:hypothetical protein